jgi:ankyrin repeat protein
MSIRTRLIAVLLVLVCGVVLSGCATTIKAPPKLVKAIEAGKLGEVESILDDNPELANAQHTWNLVSEKGESFTAFQPDGAPLLYAAVWNNNKDMVKLLLEKGADVDSFWEGKTILCWTMCLNYYEPKHDDGSNIGSVKLPHAEDMAILLINSGADVNRKFQSRWIGMGGEDCTLLHLASFKQSTELVKLLVRKGAMINVEDSYGYTPLFYSGSGTISQFLIKNGADINAVNDYGETALHYHINNKDVSEVLITNGVVVKARDRDGYTALHLVSSNQVRLGGFNGGDDRGIFTIKLPRTNERLELAKLLLVSEAKINAKNDRGETPLDLAVGKEMIDLLKEHGAVE